MPKPDRQKLGREQVERDRENRTDADPRRFAIFEAYVRARSRIIAGYRRPEYKPLSKGAKKNG